MLRNLILDWPGLLADAARTEQGLRYCSKPEIFLAESRGRFPYSLGSSENYVFDAGPPEMELAIEALSLSRPTGQALLPHALEFLAVCRKAQLRLFLVSLTPRPQAEAEATQLGVAQFFEAVSGDGFTNPLLERFLVHNNLAATETALLSGEKRAIEIARSVGVQSIIAGMPGDLAHAELADVVVRDLRELRRLLAQRPPPDEIRIEEMEIEARVGVSEDERKAPQRLAISLSLQPRRPFGEMADAISRTIDYAAVAEEVRNFVRPRTDRLIETLADAIAQHLLATFPLERIEIELRKFVLPETKYVAVRATRLLSSSR